MPCPKTQILPGFGCDWEKFDLLKKLRRPCCGISWIVSPSERWLRVDYCTLGKKEWQVQQFCTPFPPPALTNLGSRIKPQKCRQHRGLSKILNSTYLEASRKFLIERGLGNTNAPQRQLELLPCHLPGKYCSILVSGQRMNTIGGVPRLVGRQTRNLVPIRGGRPNLCCLSFLAIHVLTQVFCLLMSRPSG